ncbi:MAG: APC family permease [Micromonosporaceae bacterium]
MTKTASAPAGRLTAAQGTALYVGAVLGTGVVALPAVAAAIAGPASLLAWLALAVISAPIAGAFAALGARYPDAGGVATYARLAFGEPAAAVVGWCFYFTVPVGAPAAALWAGGYAAGAIGGGRVTVTVTALILLIGVPATNWFGVHLTSKVQLALGGLLVAFLLAAVALSLPKADLANLHPFAPHGWPAIGSAAAILVWSFAGWETVTYLTAEFRRPSRDVPRATAAAVIVVGILYLLVASATIIVLGPAAAEGEAPLGDLLAAGVGGNGRVLAAVPAVLLTFGAMNAYHAGAAKLLAALGRDGAAPAWFSRGSLAGEVPRRSLVLVAVLNVLVFTFVSVRGIGTRPLVFMTTGLFVAVYVIGVGAAVRLLPRRTPAYAAALIGLVAVIALLLMSGRYLIWPVLVTAAALLYRRLRQREPPIGNS